MAATKTKVTLKLLVDSKGHRVLFAEANKEFVDFLFNLLSLPIGTVIRIVSTDSMVGSLGSLYASVENLSDAYKQASQATVDALLKPKINSSAAVPLLLPSSHIPVDVPLSLHDVSLYVCNCINRYSSICHATTYYGTPCPNSGLMDNSLKIVDPPNRNPSTSDKKGYVKDVVTYMVMDDLEVRPMSAISSITLLNKLNIKDIGVLEEKVVDVGIDQGVELLKASLHSKTVLTEVFLGKKPVVTEVFPEKKNPVKASMSEVD